MVVREKRIKPQNKKYKLYGIKNTFFTNNNIKINLLDCRYSFGFLTSRWGTIFVSIYKYTYYSYSYIIYTIFV